VPLYEYQCGQCGRFELIRKFSDVALAACPTCGSAIDKLPSAPAIQFKGSGWYVNDYARKSSGRSEGAKADAAAAGASTEKKPDAPAASTGAKDGAGASPAAK